MANKIILVVFTFFIALTTVAQNNINDYKYVVVPMQFDFLKGKDKYRTSTLTRHLFKKEGFEVFFDEQELPEDLFENRCLALYADVKEMSKMFKNKVKIELRDCHGNLVFLSQEGSTKIKEYKKAFPIAIEKAFESIKALNYKYNPNSLVGSKNQVVVNTKEVNEEEGKVEIAKAEVERLKKEVEKLKKEKELEKSQAELKLKEKAEVKTKKIEAQKLKSQKQKVDLDVKPNSNVLFGQPTDKGFQLVDTTKKVVMVLIKTAAPNVYTVKGKEAIVFKEGDVWFYSENDSKKALNIKFQ